MRNLIRGGPPLSLWAFATLLMVPAVSVRAADPPVDVVTREVSVYISPQATPVAPDDVVTREVSLFIATSAVPVAPEDAITREVSLYIPPPDTGPVPPVDVLTREISVYMPPYTGGEAALALRIAAGIRAATPTDASRLDASATGSSGGRVDLTDATAILRRVTGLTP